MATETKFQKGQKVNFERNSTVKADQTTIIAVVKKPSESSEQSYIIEHPTGWKPNDMRISQFGLDAKKTYLFVREAELS